MPRIRYFDDYEVGLTFESRSITVTAEAIERFSEYDPQVFHRAETASETVFGRVIASGWQTAAYTMRLIVESGVFPPTGGIGVGTDELRWLRPVYAGDRLHVVVRVESLRSAPAGRSGLLRMQVWTRNQDGDDVMTQMAMAKVLRRADAPVVGG
jgi:acyl dehydratase